MKSPMYVFTENAFLCIVAHESDERLLEVRAKFRGDLERTFPEADVASAVDGDYPYSTSVSRERAAERIALRVDHIGYRSFNPTSEEPWRQAFYSDVESVIKMAHRDGIE